MATITFDNQARTAVIKDSRGETPLSNIHDAALCVDRPSCVIHNPSKHHMRDWDIIVRMDKFSLIERQCSHGIGHPDPDSLDYFLLQGQDWMGVHGCDGCCDDVV